MTDADKYFIETRFLGYQLVASEYCSDTVRARRHKKKRIDKKWLKRYGYKQIPWKNLCVTADGKIIGHPRVIDELILAARMNNSVVNDVWFR